jgi:hypothetical protein
MNNVAPIIVAIVAFLALIGGYFQFVLRGSLLPCIEFDVEFFVLSRSAQGESVGEVVCSIKNVGPGVGFIADVQCRVRYRRSGESGAGPDELEPAFAHKLSGKEQSLTGPRNPQKGNAKVRKKTTPSHDGKDEPILGDSAFYLAEGQRNFIQPGVTQWYRKPLAFPGDVNLIHVWGAFTYHTEAGKINRSLARFSQQRPEPVVIYTARRTFAMADARDVDHHHAPGGRLTSNP